MKTKYTYQEEPKLSLAESAKFLDMTESRLRGLVQRKCAPPFVKVGWNVKFPLSGLIEYRAKVA